MSKKGYRRKNAEYQPPLPGTPTSARYSNPSARSGASNCTIKNLYERITNSLRSVKLENVRAFSRKTRRYRQAYHEADTEVLKSHECIEKFLKLHKCHRNILDQESRFLENELDGAQQDGE
jgi:hypothetical protein